MIFYSQNNEDIFIYKNFINKRCESGIFVELGGYDGITYSNSKFFEETLGFKKIVLIEPTTYFNLMKQNRPNCDCYNYAISKTESKQLFIGEANNAASGLLESMNQIHIDKFINNKNTYEVDTIEFFKLLHKSNLKYIDVLSIDVEGGELNVLETMDWSIPVYIIIIELDGENQEKDDKCKNILLSNGFEFITRINNNDFFINKYYFRKGDLFDENINFFGLDENNNINKNLIYNNIRFPYMDINDYDRCFKSLTEEFNNYSSYGKNKSDLIDYKNTIKYLYNKALIKLSQIGFCTYCDYSINDRINNINFKKECIEQLENGNKIFINCHVENISYYIDEIIKILSKRNIKLYFFLMGEPDIKSDIIEKILEFSIKIFIQNITNYSNPKIHFMPIGIRDGEETSLYHKGFSQYDLVNEGLLLREKKNLCLLCYSDTHIERVRCSSILGNCNFVLNLNNNTYETNQPPFCGKVPIKLNYEKTHESYYILSPSGLGEATHRFFEAIYLDAIPIVKRTNTNFDKIYSIFPCMVINDWGEVTEELLLNNKDIMFNKLKQFKNNYPDIFVNLDLIFNIYNKI